MTRQTAYLLALVTVILTSVGFQTLAHPRTVRERQPLATFPQHLGPWNGRAEFFSPEIVQALHADEYMLHAYRDGSGPLWLYVAYYRSQPLDVRIHSPAVCLPGAGWYIKDSTAWPIRLPGRTITVNRNLVEKGDQRQLVLYWYQIQGRVVARETQAVALLAWTALTQRRNDEALVRLNAPIAGTLEGTLEREIAFVRAAFPVLSGILPQ